MLLGLHLFVGTLELPNFRSLFLCFFVALFLCFFVSLFCFGLVWFGLVWFGLVGWLVCLFGCLSVSLSLSSSLCLSSSPSLSPSPSLSVCVSLSLSLCLGAGKTPLCTKNTVWVQEKHLGCWKNTVLELRKHHCRGAEKNTAGVEKTL